MPWPYLLSWRARSSALDLPGTAMLPDASTPRARRAPRPSGRAPVIVARSLHTEPAVVGAPPRARCARRAPLRAGAREQAALNASRLLLRSLQLLDLFDELGNRLLPRRHHAVVGDLEDRRLGIFVDRDD